jgi:hypothetical protein
MYREPRDEKGRLRHHWHRWLTENIGLEKNLRTIIVLDCATTPWERVYLSVWRPFSKLNTDIELSLTDKEGNPL